MIKICKQSFHDYPFFKTIGHHKTLKINLQEEKKITSIFRFEQNNNSRHVWLPYQRSVSGTTNKASDISQSWMN